MALFFFLLGGAKSGWRGQEPPGRVSRVRWALPTPAEPGSSDLPAKGRGWKGSSLSFLSEPGSHPRGSA